MCPKIFPFLLEKLIKFVNFIIFYLVLFSVRYKYEVNLLEKNACFIDFKQIHQHNQNFFVIISKKIIFLIVNYS